MDLNIPVALALWVPLVLKASFALLLFLWVCRCIYRLYFHPLAKFPGPRIAAISDTWHAYYFTGGRWTTISEELHRKYGPVVRVNPRRLSFATVESYRDIYPYTLRDKSKIFVKDATYSSRGETHIHTERDPEKHAKMRKKLSVAFSTQSLRDQEDIIHKYVDLFIAQIGKSGNPGASPTLLKDIFEWLTFDIIGDLTFGESLGATAGGEAHFWSSAMQDAFFIVGLTAFRKRVPGIIIPILWNMPKGFMENLKKHEKMTEQMVRKRLEIGSSNNRRDFFGHLFDEQLSDEKASSESIYREMLANANILMIAGAETTKGFFIGTTHLLMANPECLAKLTHEVRSAFSSADEITGLATAHLEYLNAVIEEGLRLFPPAALGMPREVPKDGAQISGYYVPGGTSVLTEMFVVARSPQYWRQAKEFLPERWIGEGFGDRREASQPFSLGPRNCIGMNLAYLEMRIVLAKMAFVYDWEPIDRDVDLWKDSRAYTMWKTPTIRARFHPPKN
ncbi:cytochrome P450 [Xylariales sp. PMI_506]|nr:cytochrome P450 [Xylariales sp. PMI_506]